MIPNSRVLPLWAKVAVAVAYATWRGLCSKPCAAIPSYVPPFEDSHRLGKAIMLWNGDWVRSGGQDGKGLSAVREAVMWEVAFAPEACRNRPVHGLVLLSLADGATRFAIGSGDWRWSDLLGVRQSSR